MDGVVHDVGFDDTPDDDMGTGGPDDDMGIDAFTGLDSAEDGGETTSYGAAGGGGTTGGSGDVQGPVFDGGRPSESDFARASPTSLHGGSGRTRRGSRDSPTYRGMVIHRGR